MPMLGARTPVSPLRAATYGAVVGSLGVMLAWLCWVAVHAFERDALRVLIAPAIGAAVGLMLEFLVKLVRASLREAREGPTPPPDLTDEERRRVREQPDYAARSGMVALAFVFLYGVCQNLVGDLMSRLIEPFLVTLAIFFPVGFWLGLYFHEGASTPVSGLGQAARGLAGGLVAGLLAFGVAAVLGLGRFDVDTLLGLFGWWGLIGLCWGACFGDCDSPRPWAPLLGTAGAALFVAASALPPSNSSSGVFALIRPVTDRLSTQVLAYPGLPARFWDHAVEQFAEIEPAPGAERESKPPDAPSPPAGGTKPAPEGVVPPRTIGGVKIGSPQPLKLGQPRPLLSRGTGVSAVDPAIRRQQVFDREMALGLRSELVRSWLVMLWFSGAFGFARWLEARLRPLGYQRSETRRNDRRLLGWAVVLWCAAVGYVVVRGA